MKRDVLIIISVLVGVLILALIFIFSFGNLNKNITGNPTLPIPFNVSKNPFEKGTLIKGCEEGVCIKEKKILIFVDNKMYSQLANDINRFSLDIKNDLNSDIIIFWDSWNDPKSIKKIITDNKDNLYGIFLIGDLPYVKFARTGDPKLQWVSDFYYSDINNNCLYNKSYNFYDIETCASSRLTYGPWVARIKPNDKVIFTGKYGSDSQCLGIINLSAN